MDLPTSLWNYNTGYDVLWDLEGNFVHIIYKMKMNMKWPKGAGLLKKLMEGNLKIHQQMLTSIMRSPMAFFDVTPSGRILNRFSKDMDVSK